MQAQFSGDLYDICQISKINNNSDLESTTFTLTALNSGRPSNDQQKRNEIRYTKCTQAITTGGEGVYLSILR